MKKWMSRRTYPTECVVKVGARQKFSGMFPKIIIPDKGHRAWSPKINSSTKFEAIRITVCLQKEGKCSKFRSQKMARIYYSQENDLWLIRPGKSHYENNRWVVCLQIIDVHKNTGTNGLGHSFWSLQLRWRGTKKCYTVRLWPQTELRRWRYSLAYTTAINPSVCHTCEIFI